MFEAQFEFLPHLKNQRLFKRAEPILFWCSLYQKRMPIILFCPRDKSLEELGREIADGEVEVLRAPSFLEHFGYSFGTYLKGYRFTVISDHKSEMAACRESPSAD